MQLFSAGWRAVREAGPQRLFVTAVMLVLALLVSRFSWNIPFTDYAERALFDTRAYMLAEKIEQDERIMMLVYDDDMLIELEKRSPLDRGVLARALRNIDGMGAEAIGIDILFDQPQEEDAELIEVLRNMQTPTYVAYTTTDANALDIQWRQQQYLEEFIDALAGGNTQIASVRTVGDADQVVRAWPEMEPGLPPLLGRAMLIGAGQEDLTMPGYAGAIRYRLPVLADTNVIPRIPIGIYANDVVLAIPEARADLEPAIAGRYVLIGGDILDYDRIYTPFSSFIDSVEAPPLHDPDEELTEEQLAAEQEALSQRETSVRSRRPPGLEMHAEMTAQMLDREELVQPSNLFLWTYAVLVVLIAGLTALLELRNWKAVPLLVIQLALFTGLPFFLHARGVDTLGFPAIGPALGWVIAFSAVTSAARAATAVQRQFAEGALGKYLPQSIADEIIDNPELLALGGQKREIYVLFSDLEGFTKMSHAIPPEMVAKLLNRYLEMMSDVILEHGGILDKFIGDAVVAFWGAPISRPDDADRAAQAGWAIYQAGEAFRAEVAAMDPSLPKIGKTRVGLHFGEAVVGNFGGENRIQYTALGDSMNTAARMESGNKAFGSTIMATGDFASRTSLDWWRPMGRVVLSGRSSPVDLFEPAPDFPEADRKALAEALDLLESDRAAGHARLAEIAARYPDDTALAAVVTRSTDLNEACAHVLGSK